MHVDGIRSGFQFHTLDELEIITKGFTVNPLVIHGESLGDSR